MSARQHGWQLGEHNIWGKHTNFELATRVPLILRVPGAAPRRVADIVESLDLYPTLASLAGLPPPPDVDGLDRSGLVDKYGNRGLGRSGLVDRYGNRGLDRCGLAGLQGGGRRRTAGGVPGGVPGEALATAAAYSEYPRCFHNVSTPWDDTTSCTRTLRRHFAAMGYSVRVDEWRYTAWMHWDAMRLVGDFSRPPIGTELYAHPAGAADRSFDSTENDNVVKEHLQVARQLHGLVVAQWKKSGGAARRGGGGEVTSMQSSPSATDDELEQLQFEEWWHPA